MAKSCVTNQEMAALEKQSKKTVEYMGTGPLFKVIYYESINNIIGFFLQAFYLFIDTIFIGKYLGSIGLASSSLSSPFEIILCIEMSEALSVGATSLIGESLGEENITKARRYTTEFFALLVVYIIVLPIIIEPIVPQIATFLGARGQTREYLVEYLRLTFAITHIVYVINIAMSVLIRQENKPTTAMTLEIISSCANVVLDAILFTTCISKLEMRAPAISTMISQFLTDIYIIVFFCGGIKTAVLKMSWKYLKPDWSFYKKVALQFVPAFANIIPDFLVPMFMNIEFAKYGGENIDNLEAVCGLVERIESLVVSPKLGTYFGFIAVFSYNYGKQAYERCSKLIHVADWFCITVMAVVIALVEGLMKQIVGLFSDDENLVDYAIPLLRKYFSLMWLTGSLQFASGNYELEHKIVIATLVVLSKTILSTILIFTMPLFCNIEEIFWVCPVTEFLGCILGQIILRMESKRYEQMAKEEENDQQSGVAVEIAESGEKQ